MSTITTKLNLSQLKHVIQKKKVKSGEEIDCLVIPIELNNLFKSEKGNVYLDLIGFEIKEKKTDSKDTHLIKQFLPKSTYDGMTEDEKKEMKVIGNHVLWSAQEPDPNSPVSEPIDEDDDLPF